MSWLYLRMVLSPLWQTSTLWWKLPTVWLCSKFACTPCSKKDDPATHVREIRSSAYMRYMWSDVVRGKATRGGPFDMLLTAPRLRFIFGGCYFLLSHRYRQTLMSHREGLCPLFRRTEPNTLSMQTKWVWAGLGDGGGLLGVVYF